MGNLATTRAAPSGRVCILVSLCLAVLAPQLRPARANPPIKENAAASPGNSSQPMETAYGEPDYLRYEERPLEAADFRGMVPETRPLEEPRIEAYSYTDLHYEFRSRARRRGNRWTVELVDVVIRALFHRTRSWNALPDDARLLDHHQGHFDLTELAAREAERQVKPSSRPARPLIGRGRNEGEAMKDLEQQIQRHVAGHLESLKRDIEYFDQITRYGTLPDIEARERQKQKQLLERSVK